MRSQADRVSIEEFTCRKLFCWLEKRRQLREEPGIFPTIEVIESGLSCHMPGHSTLSPLCIVENCVSEIYQGCRSIGKFGDRIDFITCRVHLIGIRIPTAYLQETLLLLAREAEAV